MARAGDHPDAPGPGRFDSLDDLLRDGKLNGYYGGMRLVRAAIKRFADYCRLEITDLLAQNFSIRYDSNIPRQQVAGRVERDYHRDDPRPLRVLRSGHPSRSCRD